MTFQGRWTDRYFKNIPGPLYSTSDNLMELMSSFLDRKHIIYDDVCEFVWRQPEDGHAAKETLIAMGHDCAGSFQVDGNHYWTPALVKDWWAERHALVEWANRITNNSDEGAGFKWEGYYSFAYTLKLSYLQYLNTDAEQYLRKYLFLLLNDRPWDGHGSLPDL